VRRGISEEKPREGVILRPLIEVCMNNGERIIAKHKRPEFSERKTNPPVDPAKGVILAAANAIADEWVTEMRLDHVLDHLGNPNDMTDTSRVIAAMVEDVLREASGEIVDSREARAAISRKAALMFKARVMGVLQ